jgi:hypothetical protein
VTFTPHPYALLLPALTEEEYAALRADIEEHGILVPVITDADRLVLDGVHRTRIAEELGIEVPVSQMGQETTEERKMHLAVGLNLRRRHLDADRRRELVRKLNAEQGLSVRKIASVTGWSKSTVDRDLRTSPFEEAIGAMAKSAADLRRRAEDTSSEFTRELAEMFDSFGTLLGWADAQWKRGNWPPPPIEHAEATLAIDQWASGIGGIVEASRALLHGDRQEADRLFEESEREDREKDERFRRWRKAAANNPEGAERFAKRLQDEGKLWRVPDGTPAKRDTD